MKVGSKVRVIGIPDGLEDYPDFPTKSTFMKCVGREFVIAGFNEVGMAEIGIESVNGSVGETIWIELLNFLNWFQSSPLPKFRLTGFASHYRTLLF